MAKITRIKCTKNKTSGSQFFHQKRTRKQNRWLLRTCLQVVQHLHCSSTMVSRFAWMTSHFLFPRQRKPPLDFLMWGRVTAPLSADDMWRKKRNEEKSNKQNIAMRFMENSVWAYLHQQQSLSTLWKAICGESLFTEWLTGGLEGICCLLSASCGAAPIHLNGLCSSVTLPTEHARGYHFCKGKASHS